MGKISRQRIFSVFKTSFILSPKIITINKLKIKKIQGNIKALFDRNSLKVKFFKTLLKDASKKII